MNVDGALTREGFTGFAAPHALASRYAWLELEAGSWHFLTNLFAAPDESSRRWSSKQSALDELLREGWVVVGPYPQTPSSPHCSGNGVAGYGLMWMGD